MWNGRFTEIRKERFELFKSCSIDQSAIRLLENEIAEEFPSQGTRSIYLFDSLLHQTGDNLEAVSICHRETTNYVVINEKFIINIWKFRNIFEIVF